MTGAPPRTSETLLLRTTLPTDVDRVWCTSPGRAQWARDVAARLPAARVVCQFLDVYQAEQARAAAPLDPRVELVCVADPPDLPCQLVGLPLSARGDGELAREWLQHGHRLLDVGGELLASTDNPRDVWLRGELARLFERVRIEPHAEGIVYRARKTARPVKYKNFRAACAFRDGDRILQLVTRPGVFSHRRLDVGARALIEAMEIAPDQRVLDLGCGSGAVSFAAACRAPGVRVEALDANVRAVECTQAGAEVNGLADVVARLDASASRCDEAAFDAVVTNPPYFSHGRIAEILFAGAWRALRPEGRLWVVTKDPQAVADALDGRFTSLDVRPVRAYWVLCGRKSAAEG